ncbi:MAG: hypothetical protein L0211_20035 [Planctomycetaceae bacterium]|nr:hypothetical protein [Planctomycetaceae bacterium]
MTTAESTDLARRAEAIYANRLKDELELTHRDEFVAIEPDSGEYFLGRTLSEAVGLAREAHPGRLVHSLRVGHKTAVHFGASQR